MIIDPDPDFGGCYCLDLTKTCLLRRHIGRQQRPLDRHGALAIAVGRVRDAQKEFSGAAAQWRFVLTQCGRGRLPIARQAVQVEAPAALAQPAVGQKQINNGPPDALRLGLRSGTRMARRTQTI